MKLQITRQKKDGGYTVFCLKENGEDVRCSPRIADLAETMVEDYPEIAKEIIEAKNRNEHYPETGQIALEVENHAREKFLNIVQELYIAEYAQVDMDQVD